MLFACFWLVKSGVQKHISLLFCLLLYFLYEVFVPISDALRGVTSFFGFSITGDSGLHHEVVLVYTMGILALILAYWFFSKLNFTQFFIDNQEAPEIPQVRNLYRAIILYQVVVWLAIIWNIHQSGVSLSALLDLNNRSEKDILFSINWYSYGIDLWSNSLSVALFLQFQLRKKPDAAWVFFFSIWLIFCLLAGWRYRIILFFLFFLFQYFRSSGLKWKRIWIIGLLFLVGIPWLTLNRMAIAKRQFQHVTFDLRQFDMEILSTELSNSRTFKASLIYLKNNHLESGGLSSWVDYGLNKLKPKSSFPNSVRPFPWIIQMTKNWIPPGWPWNPNPAVTQMEELYLTFSWSGLLFGMAMMGIWVAFLDQPGGGFFLRSLQVLGSGLTFQFISRGFFLYQVQIALASLLPLLLLYVLNRYLPHAKKNNPA